MAEWLRAYARKFLFFVAIAAGAAVLVVMVKSRGGPHMQPPSETARAVRVIVVAPVDVIPRALGFGTVQPGRTFEAVAEVRGKVIGIHANLKKGALIRTGAVLLELDQVPYRLAIAQIDANIRSVQAKLAELTVKGENTRASLAIEERSLALSVKDLQRKRQLLAGNNASQASVDQEERNVLARRLNVQTQRNTLNLMPVEGQALEAELALYRARLADAKHDLQRTVITAPFDLRVAEVGAEQEQYAAVGTVLARFDGIDVAEVAAQLPIERLMAIVARNNGRAVTLDSAAARLPEVLGISPLVRLKAGDSTIEWPARLARISDTVDPATRTVGVIVAVDNPYGNARPGLRPPLVKGMFVEVELRGQARKARIVVPRSALLGGFVHVVDGGGRLAKRAVSIESQQANFAIIASGLEAGTKVVVSDPVPAIEGMLLAPEEDTDLNARMTDEATGKGPVR